MDRKKMAGISALLAALILVFLISSAYSQFASHQIHLESASHLEEIYSQINSTFRSTVTKNWRLLLSWRPYVSGMADADPEAFQAFIQAEKRDWQFTNFYFLSEDGSYLTDQGVSGSLNLRENLELLVDRRENIVTDSALPSGQITVFAVPIEPGQYQGFDYTAIAFSFNTDDMSGSLSIEAFSGASDSYIIYPDGRILFSSQNLREQPYNFLAYLRSHGRFNGVDADALAQEWRAGVQRTLTCSLDGTPYYLSYQPVGFSDWVLASLAPASIVNASMDHFTLVTLAVMALLFGIIALTCVLLLVWCNRRRMWEKNREILAREELFDLLTANTDDIFILFSPADFTAEYVSPNLERVLGLDAEEIRRDVRPLIFGDADQIFPHIEPVLSAQTLAAIPMGGIWTGERDLLHAKTQELRWFKQLLQHCSLEKKEQFILMLSDRTKERQMNEALGEALHTAKAANEAKSNFLANMSHDIRTPMNAIVGFSVLLGRDAGDPDKVRMYTRKIAASSQHLLNLINDILDMSKIESGKTSLNRAEFSLPQMIEELYSMLLPQAQAKNQHFELHIKGSPPKLLLGDKLRLSQVLINLLSNAIKYTQEGGQISLTVQDLVRNTANRAHLRFTVADNGLGMSESFLQTIFDPFSREITDATREIQGTGLGMAITKNIVDLMGGTITVESELEKGSTFTVELELPLSGQKEDDGFWPRHKVTRLLVVDDEEDICLDVQNSMEGTGVEVSYATSGAAAVELAAAAHAQGHGFPIVLLDWKMPGMDGLETARRIRENVGPDIPIFVLTSYELDEAKEAAKDANIDLFLPKPFFLSSFQQAVSHLLHQQTEESQACPPEALSLNGLSVLAAEDNEINGEILLELLEIEGVQCELVPNGQEAVDRFLRAQPGEFDLIFMDVQMPVMDGYDATRAIRASGHPEAKTIPIIAMTANAFEEDIQAAMTAGMSAHLAKPIDMDKLKAIIARLRKQPPA